MATEFESVCHRPLYEIASEIKSEIRGKSFYPYAEAYLEPMLALDSIHDNYLMDTAESIVAYLLANLGSWRGEKAREIKAELKSILKVVR